MFKSCINCSFCGKKRYLHETISIIKRCLQKTNKDIIITNRYDEKIFFGKLVKEKSTFNSLPPVDSELEWVKQSSKQIKRIRILKPSKKSENSDQKIAENNDQKMAGNNDQKMAENKASMVKLPEALINYLPQYPLFRQEKKTDFDDVKKDDPKIMTISSREDKACAHYPSVTNILSATMSEEAKLVLEKWKLRMIEELGMEGFEKYKSELLSNGKLMHEAIFCQLTKESFDVPDQVQQSLSSLSGVLDNISVVKAIESHVIHPQLLYRGIVDCVAYYEGELCAIDWKKSDKTKSTVESTYDAPLQLMSYIGALNADPRYAYKINKGMIVVAYTDGQPATVHEISKDSLHKYWELWLQRLQNYHISHT